MIWFNTIIFKIAFELFLRRCTFAFYQSENMKNSTAFNMALCFMPIFLSFTNAQVSEAIIPQPKSISYGHGYIAPSDIRYVSIQEDAGESIKKLAEMYASVIVILRHFRMLLLFWRSKPTFITRKLINCVSAKAQSALLPARRSAYSMPYKVWHNSLTLQAKTSLPLN